MFLTLAEIQAFINFVNGNLGKKIFTDELISNVVPGKKLLTNGVGLGVDLVDDITYQLGIVGSWNIDNLDTPPVDVLEGQRYYVSTAGTFNGIYAGKGDIVEFLSLTEIFVYPLESTLVRLSTLNNYATKTYAQSLVAGLLDDRGSYHPTLTKEYPSSADNGSGINGAILKGDIWFISADGIVGTKPVYTGYSVRALIDNPGQTESNWDILNVGLGYVPENTANKKTSTNGALGSVNDIDFPTTKVVSDGLALKANIANQTHTGNTRLPSSLKFYDVGTNTKEVGLDISQVSAATTRTITVPDRNVTLGDIPIFQATTNYKQYSVIQENGTIYSAKVDFTSGASFSASDWNALGSSIIKESFSGDLTLQIGHEYYNVSPPNTPITLELPDPTLVPDGSVIIIHNLGFNSTTTLGRSAWPLPAPSKFLQAPEYQGFTTSTIPAYSKGVITTLSSISNGGWLVEKQNSNVIALSSTPGAGKTYFTREDDVSATLGYNLGAIPTATNRVITMPNANVDLGKVAQAATTSVDGYLTSADWNKFNNKQAALADVVTTGTYGSATQYPVITFNAKGIATAITLQTIAAPATFSDSTFRVYDNADANKILAFEVSGIVPNTTGSPLYTPLPTTRTITIPNASINLGDLSSVATTNNNVLSAGNVRCRIEGGSNNTVGGTDNASIMSHRSSLTGTGNTTINCGATGGVAGTGVTCAGTRNTFINCKYITLASGATDNTFTNCSNLIVSANTKGCTFINATSVNGDNIPYNSVITGSGSGSSQSCTIKHWLKAETFSDGIPVVAKIVGYDAAATNDRTLLRINTGSYENGNSTHEITIRGTSEISNLVAVAGTIARRFVSVNNRLTGYSPVQPDILYIETVGIDTVQGNGAAATEMNLPVITITKNGLFLEIAISITSPIHASQPKMSFDVEVVSNYSIFV